MIAPTVEVRCPVRGCGAPLTRGERRWRCPCGHLFDVSRRGYVNLLQPQDRRSPKAGDPRTATAARLRLAERGHLAPFAAALRALLERHVPPEGAPWLDVGAGDGWLLRELALGRELELHALDLARPAVELGARLVPQATWVVANADRGLPYGDRSFGLVLSITSRWAFAEMARVLRPGAYLLLALAGADDLLELRERVHGTAHAKDRLERALAEASARFEVVTTETVRWRMELDRESLGDLLASSYRGARARDAERVAALESLAITMSRDVALLTPR